METLNLKIDTRRESETQSKEPKKHYANQNLKLILKLSGLNTPIPSIVWQLGLEAPRSQDIM